MLNWREAAEHWCEHKLISCSLLLTVEVRHPSTSSSCCLGFPTMMDCWNGSQKKPPVPLKKATVLQTLKSYTTPIVKPPLYQTELDLISFPSASHVGIRNNGTCISFIFLLKGESHLVTQADSELNVYVAQEKPWIYGTHPASTARVSGLQVWDTKLRLAFYF